MSEGKSNWDISSELGITFGSVRPHRYGAMRKAGARTATSLIEDNKLLWTERT